MPVGALGGEAESETDGAFPAEFDAGEKHAGHLAAPVGRAGVKWGGELLDPRALAVALEVGDDDRQPVGEVLSHPAAVGPERIKAEAMGRSVVGADAGPAVDAELVEGAVLGDERDEMAAGAHPRGLPGAVPDVGVTHVLPTLREAGQGGFGCHSHLIQRSLAGQGGEVIRPRERVVGKHDIRIVLGQP